MNTKTLTLLAATAAGRVLAGTQDGMLAMLRANGKVFSIGSVRLERTASRGGFSGR